MKRSHYMLIQPDEVVEFAEEIAGDEMFYIHVKLDANEQNAVDPHSYVEHDWEEKGANIYALKIRNITSSPVYVSVEDAL